MCILKARRNRVDIYQSTDYGHTMAKSQILRGPKMNIWDLDVHKAWFFVEIMAD